MKAAAFGAWLHRLAPCAGPSSNRDWLRAVLGCGFALGLCMPLCAWLFGVDTMLRIGPPLAASALLAIAVPSSPLAQPWSLLGGNLVAALVGLLLGHWLGHSWPQASLSMVVAVLLMLGLRCLHPPSTAMAFSLAVGGPLVDQHLLHLLLPVGVASLALIGVALVYNNLTRRRWPHVHHTAAVEPGGARFTRSDLDAALAHYNQVLDISREDLQDLLQHAEAAAYRRTMGELRCADVMTPDPVVARAFDIDYAWDFYHAMSDVLTASAPASKLRETWELAAAKYPKGALRLRFSDNHDQLRATGSYGLPAALAASAVMYTLDGVPLLYNGMEVADGTESAAPALFEKTTIDWGMAERRPLGQLPVFEALDSLAVDSDGWVCAGALVQGGIACFHPDGRTAIVPAPRNGITNICFGGADMRDVWITAGDTGEVFKARWDVPGLRLNHYA